MNEISKNKKTILILTAHFGAGHISAANAIKEYILDIDDSYDILIQNFISASIPKMNTPLVKFYETQTKYTPGLYNCYYYLKKSVDPRFDVVYRMYTSKLSKYILEANPSIIISTFPLAAACVYDFKTKNPDFNIPSLTVVTDVVDSSEWIFPNTDMYFVPSKEIKNRYIHKGISPSSIKVTGVPVKRDFSYERIENENTYKVLLMGGGRGLFDVDISFMHYLDELVCNNKEKLEVTIVTGQNKKLYDKLTKKNALKSVNIMGFCTEMPELMKKHNLIVTKPGGATLFEAISSELPIIVKLPKVGQEIENGKFIIDKGVGLIYSDEDNLKQIFNSFIDGSKDNLFKFMVENIKDFKTSIQVDQIGHFVLDFIKQKAKE